MSWIKINMCGTTRIVFVLKYIVVKIPNFTVQWSHFLGGLLANIRESNCWKWNSGKYETGNSELLCPVKWCSWGGWILIMQRANVDDHCYEVYNKGMQFNYANHIKAGFATDIKPENFGYMDNRLVIVDYGQ